MGGYFKPKDFYVGAEVTLNKFQLKIYDVDAHRFPSCPCCRFTQLFHCLLHFLSTPVVRAVLHFLLVPACCALSLTLIHLCHHLALLPLLPTA